MSCLPAGLVFDLLAVRASSISCFTASIVSCPDPWMVLKWRSAGGLPKVATMPGIWLVSHPDPPSKRQQNWDGEHGPNACWSIRNASFWELMQHPRRGNAYSRQHWGIVLNPLSSIWRITWWATADNSRMKWTRHNCAFPLFHPPFYSP